jgi:predicted esterase
MPTLPMIPRSVRRPIARATVVAKALVVLAVAAHAAAPAPAQEVRAELGRRLARFETAWQEADPATRALAVNPMEEAVRCFFSLQLGTAAKRLDEAWCAVRGGTAADDAERHVASRAVVIDPRLADVGEARLAVGLPALYDAPPRPAGARIELAIADATGRQLATTARDWTADSIDWDLGALPEGDHTLTVTCAVGDRQIACATRGLSRVARLAERGAALERAARGWPEGADKTAHATVAATADLVEALADSRQQETDYPVARMVALAEGLVAGGDGAIAAAARAHDVWLTLATAAGQVPVRLRAPETAAGALPVLFLLHGAGGSENMFFETCGAGRAARLGVERGWLVVAPRQGILGLGLDVDGMLEALAVHFPIDRSRVFLVGHSMGAVQTSRQVAKHPGLVAAAVGLGGGGTVSKDEAARRVPWFIAAGAHDFGKRGAEALAKQLTAAGSAVTYREIPDVEHMVIVQAALDEVFSFLDGVAARGE